MAKAPIEIRSLARQHTETAIKTLVEVMSDVEVPPAARVAASQALLDRGWGKPAQVNADANSEAGKQILGWFDGGDVDSVSAAETISPISQPH